KIEHIHWDQDIDYGRRFPQQTENVAFKERARSRLKPRCRISAFCGAYELMVGTTQCGDGFIPIATCRPVETEILCEQLHNPVGHRQGSGACEPPQPLEPSKLIFHAAVLLDTWQIAGLNGIS